MIKFWLRLFQIKSAPLTYMYTQKRQTSPILANYFQAQHTSTFVVSLSHFFSSCFFREIADFKIQQKFSSIR